MRRKIGYAIGGLALVALGLVVWSTTRRAPAHAGAEPSATHSHSLDGKLAPLFEITSSKGPDSAVDSLVALAARDSEVSALRPLGLHHVAHSIGRMALRNNNGRPEIFARCRPNYVAGCYHGVIEAFFATKPALDSGGLAALCNRISPPAPLQVRRECAHGMGHGLMRTASFKINSALTQCSELTDQILRRECGDGVFMTAMERELNGVSLRPTLLRRVARRFGIMRNARPCIRVESAFQASCWSYEPAFFLSRDSRDLVTALHKCDAAPPGSIGDCYAGFARQAQGPEPDIAKRIANACRSGRRDLAAACRAGAVTYYSDLTWTADGGASFCRTLPSDEKSDCYRSLGELMGLMQPNRTAAERECMKVELDMQSLCKTGVRAFL